MSLINVPGFASTAHRSFVLGDAIDLTPDDLRFTHAYAATTRPGGSVATFAGAVITPDVAGRNVLTVTAGTDVLTCLAFVFSAAIYAGISTRLDGTTRPDAERRQILGGLARSVPIAALSTWNAGGAFPPGVDSSFRPLGSA